MPQPHDSIKENAVFLAIALGLAAQSYSPGPELTGQLSGGTIGGSQEELAAFTPIVDRELASRDYYLACVMQKAGMAKESVAALDIAVDVGVRLCRPERDAAIEAIHLVELALKPTGAAAMAAVERSDMMLRQIVVEVTAYMLQASRGEPLPN